jgi:hypothetical protein
MTYYLHHFLKVGKRILHHLLNPDPYPSRRVPLEFQYQFEFHSHVTKQTMLMRMQASGKLRDELTLSIQARPPSFMHRLMSGLMQALRIGITRDMGTRTHVVDTWLQRVQHAATMDAICRTST